MNSFRRPLEPPDVVPPVDGAGDPPEPPVRARGGGGRPRRPRRPMRRVATLVIAAAVLKAIAHGTLIVTLIRDLPWQAYAAAAGVFLGTAITLAAVVGRAFHRAWHREARGA